MNAAEVADEWDDFVEVGFEQPVAAFEEVHFRVGEVTVVGAGGAFDM